MDITTIRFVSKILPSDFINMRTDYSIEIYDIKQKKTIIFRSTDSLFMRMKKYVKTK